MTQNLSVVIVEKTGTLKMTTIKEYKEEDLYKKCGFKTSKGFSKQTEWTIKLDGSKYVVAMFAKSDGKANTENKYDFPPPVDSTLYFGACALVCKQLLTNDNSVYKSLTVELWEKIYEKLFGGFDNLAITCIEDENEEDELANIPAEKKTKQGYLKDGFVVDSDGDDSDASISDSSSEFEDDNNNDQQDGTETEDIQDIGSELSSEDYEYSDQEKEKVQGM